MEKYTEILNIKYSETDQNFLIKPYSLLNFLQDIASKNAEDLGFGYSLMKNNNCAWYLIKYRMEFEEYPSNIEEITLETEPRGYNKIFAYRNFTIRKKQKIIARISSIWSIVNIKTHAMLPIQEIIDNPNMPVFTKNEEDLTFSKITSIKKSDIEQDFTVRYNDLDVNGHANNGNYIIWAFEPLSSDFKNTHRIKTLDIIYKKEAKYGENITSQISYKTDKTTVHCLKNENGEDLCLLECQWETI